jgi:tRNA G10  N-methylase Trm11
VDLPQLKLTAFNEAMQYISFSPDHSIPPLDAVLEAAKRCSLIHSIYQIVARAENYEDLAPIAIDNGGFEDLMEGGDNVKSTWCFRARVYGELPEEEEEREEGKDIRYGGRARSMTAESEALNALKPLLIKFKARVNLKEPDCKIYIFDGLKGGKPVLARRLMTGPQISIMNPNTRICVTNTPLCPIAAFSLCNVAQVQNGQTILDPFAGSCATLIAATMIAPDCQTVGIEIAHDGIVNRDDIRQDFSTRNLKEPVALIEGDSTNTETVRDSARNAIGENQQQPQPFDAIITDPPYGIRESKSSKTIPPLSELFIAMGKDKENGKPLLKLGGKLVAFVPVSEEETLEETMPSEELCKEAGLELKAVKEQPLNDKLSRWLVSYTCVD